MTKELKVRVVDVAGKWNDVWFAGEERPSGNPGYVRFVSARKDTEPEYHVHFSLARIEDGKYNTLDFGYGAKISEMTFGFSLDPGMYMLTTGNRDDNGNVLASVSFFALGPGEDKTISVSLREIPESEVSGGKINLTGYLPTYSGERINPLSLADRGVVFIWIEPGRAPTRHLLNDLPRLQGEYDNWGGSFVFLTDPARTPDGFSPEDVTGTPRNLVFVTDTHLAFMTSALGEGAAERPLPVVLYCNKEGDVLFFSEGYRIGTGEQILNKIR